jgi:hypothetical protein
MLSRSYGPFLYSVLLIMISIQVFGAGGLLQRKAYRRKDYIRRENYHIFYTPTRSLFVIGRSLAMLDVLEAASVYVFDLAPRQRFHARLTGALRLCYSTNH